MNSRFCLWLGATLIAVALSGAASSQQDSSRVALVVGNANYPEAGTPLPTIINDVRALADGFRSDEFDVDLKENVGKADMQRAIDAFMAKIHNGTVALFYFGGFGIQVAQQNYLVPVDARISNETDVQQDGISIDAILAEMQRRGARVKIVIIDAARQNPFEPSFRPAALGLAALAPPDGTLALYSELPGKVINDGTGEYSPFASELIKELKVPNLTAEDAFNRTRISVSQASSGAQIPWVSSSLLEEFSFVPTHGVASAPPPPVSSAPPPVSTAPPPVSAAPPPVSAAPPPHVSAAPPPPVSAAPPPHVSAAPPPPSPPPPPTPPKPMVYKPGIVFRDCAECGEMVVVPNGSYDMGSGSMFEQPVHRVTIGKPFAIGRYLVTFREWDLCIESGGCKYRPDDRSWGRGNRPVIDVSWLDAKDFLKWLSEKTGKAYRLASEAEWEFAARAGTATPYWWGREVGTGNANCSNCGTGGNETLPVGTFKPNPFGLFDTAGNAAEWVEDCWNDDYRHAPRDGSPWTSGQCQLRVLRGGAFDSDARYLRSAARFRYDFDVRYVANGFRVMREIP